MQTETNATSYSSWQPSIQHSDCVCSCRYFHYIALTRVQCLGMTRCSTSDQSLFHYHSSNKSPKLAVLFLVRVTLITSAPVSRSPCEHRKLREGYQYTSYIIDHIRRQCRFFTVSPFKAPLGRLHIRISDSNPIQSTKIFPKLFLLFQ
jgi:hypothetical protein